MSTYILRLASEVLNRPLMCDGSYLETFLATLGGRIGVDAADLSTGSYKALEHVQIKSAGVAHIPIIGSLTHRASNLDAPCGLRSYQAIGQEIDAAMAKSATHTILLELDSPGGSAVGAFELADKIAAAAKSRRVIAFVDGSAMSAAYLLASRCTAVYATPSSSIGSIGVVTAHVDRSKQLEMAGVKPTFIIAGSKKVDGNSANPLPDQVRIHIQADIDKFYAMFVDAVAAGRGIAASRIRATEAAIFSAIDADTINLVDDVKTREQVIALASDKCANLKPSLTAEPAAVTAFSTATPPRPLAKTPIRQKETGATNEMTSAEISHDKALQKAGRSLAEREAIRLTTRKEATAHAAGNHQGAAIAHARLRRLYTAGLRPGEM